MTKKPIHEPLVEASRYTGVKNVMQIACEQGRITTREEHAGTRMIGYLEGIIAEHGAHSGM